MREADKPKATRPGAKLLIGQGLPYRAGNAWHGCGGQVTAAGSPAKRVNKVKEGRPHCVDMIKNGEIQFIANTTEGKKSISESQSIRAAAIAVQTVLLHHHRRCLRLQRSRWIISIGVDVNRLQDLHLQKSAEPSWLPQFL